MSTVETPSVKHHGDSLGTGRRKTSVARVRVRAGKGTIVVNGRAFENFFVREQDRNAVLAPLAQTDRVDSVDVLDQRSRRRHHRPGGRLQARAGPGLEALRRRPGRLAASGSSADARQPHEGTQALRSAWCPPRDPVLEAVIGLRRILCRFFDQLRDRRSFAEFHRAADRCHLFVRRIDAQGRQHRGMHVGYAVRVGRLFAPFGIGRANDLPAAKPPPASAMLKPCGQ